MKKPLIFCIFLILISEISCAQKEGNIWCFGNAAGVSFNSGAPVSFSGVAMNQTEGCSSIADAAGNLLFYTNGITVWNKNNVSMPNGTGLYGHISSTQSGLIVQQPDSAYIYYVFTTDAALGSYGFNYSIVDMRLQGGLGDVTAKNINVLPLCNERVTAVRHANGKDIWVITTRDSSNIISTYLLSSSGFNSTPVSDAAIIIHSASISYAGYLKPSLNGKRLTVALFD